MHHKAEVVIIGDGSLFVHKLPAELVTVDDLLVFIMKLPKLVMVADLYVFLLTFTESFIREKSFRTREGFPVIL